MLYVDTSRKKGEKEYLLFEDQKIQSLLEVSEKRWCVIVSML